MALPSPKFPLDGACSVIYSDTLFSYSTDGNLQSLKLQPGAEWKQLSQGFPVEGAACVKSTPQDASTSALWVIGGATPDSSYPGLQRFSFADNSWENITLINLVTQDRVYHSAVYLNASNSILVYAGQQDGSEQLSSSTFTIQAAAPYAIQSYQSNAPAISPLLMPWTDSQAVMVYGPRAMVFDPTLGPAKAWFDSGATLTNPIYNTSTVKGLMVLAADSSKSLYTFDLSVAPNQVNRTMLVNNKAAPIQNAQPTASVGSGTLDPSTTRHSYSAADDGNGLVVFSGGNDQDPLAMFQASENSWLNTTEALVLPGQHNAASTTTSSSTTSATASSTSSSTAASTTSSSPTATNSATNNSSAGLAFPVKILVAVLASILGAALIIVLILLILRCRRRRRAYDDAGHQRRASGIPNAEKEVVEYAGRGLSGKASTRQYRSHRAQESQASFNSVAILMGRVGSQQRGHGSNHGSDASSQFNKKYRAEISNPIPMKQTL